MFIKHPDQLERINLDNVLSYYSDDHNSIGPGYRIIFIRDHNHQYEHWTKEHKEEDLFWWFRRKKDRDDVLSTIDNLIKIITVNDE